MAPRGGGFPAGIVLGRVGASLLVLPLLLTTFIRIPGGLLAWATLCLLGVFMLGLFCARPSEYDERWRSDLGRVGLFTALAVGLQLAAAPERLLFLLAGSPELYTGARVVGAAGALAASVGILRGLPAWLRGRRAAGRVQFRGGGDSVVAQLREGAVARAEDLLRSALLCVLAAAGMVVFGVWGGWAFWEGWVALIVAWLLLAERPWVTWQSEGARTVLHDVPRPGRGSAYAGWRGFAAAWLMVVTGSFSAALGGIRPSPTWAVLGFGLAAALATGLPATLLRGREDRVLARWLDAAPGRRAEIEAWRDRTSGDRQTPFGDLPGTAP